MPKYGKHINTIPILVHAELNWAELPIFKNKITKKKIVNGKQKKFH